MNFQDFNKKWVDRLLQSKHQIISSQAVQQVEEYLLSDNAHIYKFLPFPLAFPLDAYNALSQAARDLLSAQTKIIRHFLHRNDKKHILDLFGIPATLSDLFDWEELERAQTLISRFDIVPSNAGYYFCEINTDSSVGGTEDFGCLNIYSKALGWPNVVGWESPCVDISNKLSKIVSERHIEQIVLLNSSGYEGIGYPSLNILKTYIAAAIPHVRICIVDENSYPVELYSTDRGAKTLVYRLFVALDSVQKHLELLERILRSGATVINTFETEVRMSKKWFSIFHSESYRELLSPSEIASIDGYVPYTYDLDAENFNSSILSKDEYIFKLNSSYGGGGVIIGRSADEGTLRSALLGKGLSNWSVQKFIEFDGLEIPNNGSFETTSHDFVFGLYVVDDQVRGIRIRASNCSKIVNVSLGVAKVTWAIPLSEAERDDLLACFPETYPSAQHDK